MKNNVLTKKKRQPKSGRNLYRTPDFQDNQTMTSGTLCQRKTEMVSNATHLHWNDIGRCPCLTRERDMIWRGRSAETSPRQFFVNFTKLYEDLKGSILGDILPHPASLRQKRGWHPRHFVPPHRLRFVPSCRSHANVSQTWTEL